MFSRCTNAGMVGIPLAGILNHYRGSRTVTRRKKMISTGDLKKGVTIEFEGQLCSILDWQHVKMGRGGAIVRLKLRNLRSGATFDRTCDAGEKFPRVYLDRSTVTYQYQDGEQYHFMDTSTYD